MSRTTEEPQRVGSSRANAEWKADPGLGNIIHGNNEPGSLVDRSFKAAPAPAATDPEHDNIVGGEGSRGIKKWTGDGKGPLNPEESVPKKRSALI